MPSVDQLRAATLDRYQGELQELAAGVRTHMRARENLFAGAATLADEAVRLVEGWVAAGLIQVPDYAAPHDAPPWLQAYRLFDLAATNMRATREALEVSLRRDRQVTVEHYRTLVRDGEVLVLRRAGQLLHALGALG